MGCSFWAVLPLLFDLTNPTADALGNVQLDVHLRMQGRDIQLENKQYYTAKGDSLYLDACRFYLSGFELKSAHSTGYKEPNSYHLFDAEDPETAKIMLNSVPATLYDSLVFWVGTDSLANVSGAMSGDLDPTKGMYWAWNSGYINFKLEGRSNACNTRRHMFEFHVGGYLPPYPTVRRVALPLANCVVRQEECRKLALMVDLDGFFKHIRLAECNSVMIPGARAAELADYFKTVFSIN